MNSILRTGLLAAVTAMASTGAFAANDRTALVPDTSAYTVLVPDAAQTWTDWKANQIYKVAKDLMESEDFAPQVEQLKTMLASTETALGYKIDGDTLSSIFSDATLYVSAGENAGKVAFGAAFGVSDKEKAEKLIELAEQGAAEGMKNAGNKDADESEDKPAKKKSGKKAKDESEDSEKKDSNGGADDADKKNPVTSEQYKGVTVKRLSAQDDQEIFYVLTDDLFLVSNEADEIKALVDRSKGKSEGTISKDAKFKKTSTGLGAEGNVFVFVNNKLAMDIQPSQPGMEKMKEAITKLSPADYQGSAIDINPKDISARSYALLNDSAFAKVVKANPGDKAPGVLAFVPEKPIMAFATTFIDAPLFFGTIKDIAESAGADGVDEKLKMADDQVGFSIQDDLVAGLGNEMGLCVNGVKVSQMPQVDAALIFKVKDKAKIAKVIAGIEKTVAKLPLGGGGDDEDAKPAKKSGSPLKTKTVGKVSVKYVDIPGVAAYNPAWALEGDYWIIATNLASISKVLDVKAGTANGLADGEALKKLGGKVTTKGNAFQYIAFEEIIGIAKPFAGLVGGNDSAKVQKLVDALDVLVAAAGNSQVKDGALVGDAVLVLK